jgi:AcrR family transcriptional regulator
VEDRVFEAAASELAETGFDGFSVRSVARRSGVSRPSLLLRWPTRDELILETVQRVLEWPAPDPQAPFLDELTGIVRRIVELMQPKYMGIHLRLALEAPNHPQLFADYQNRVMSKAANQLSTLLERAVAEGELPNHVDCRWAGDALVGVLFIRSMAAPGQKPLSVVAQDRIVETFLTTLRGGQPG